MRSHGTCGLLTIRAKTRRKFKATPDSNHPNPIAPNLLAEPEHPPTGPNQGFVSDITYIRTQEGWLYLAAVMDLYTRAIVGWAIKPRMATDLVLDALTMAWFRKHPEPGAIFHSDRGSQYAAKAMRNRIKKYHLQPSMSGKGSCFERAACPRGITRRWKAFGKRSKPKECTCKRFMRRVRSLKRTSWLIIEMF